MTFALALSLFLSAIVIYWAFFVLVEAIERRVPGHIDAANVICWRVTGLLAKLALAAWALKMTVAALVLG